MKIDHEKIIIAAFFSLLLWMSYANYSNNQLQHDFPYGYLASDAFQHQARAEYVKEQGNYATELPSMTLGFRDVAGFYQPITSQLAAILSHTTGLETYDTLILITAIMLSLIPLIVYFTIKQFSKNVAMLSLPIMAMLFTKNFQYGFLFGQWPFIIASMFLAATAWAMTKTEMEKAWILLALFLSATLMSHAAELIFIAGFVAAVFGIKLVRGKLEHEEFKNITLGVAVFAIITLYQWAIIKNSWFTTMPYKFAVETTTGGAFPDALITEFGIALIPVAAGIILGLIILLKETNIPLMFGYFMLAAGFTNLIGFGARAFQTRFIWPAYLAVFFGLGIYQAGKMLVKNWKTAYSIAISAALITAIVLTSYHSQANQGIMDPYHWEALNWIKQNTEQDRNVLFLYGDTYRQTSVLYNTGRVNYYVDLNDYATATKSSYTATIANDVDAGLIYKTGILSFANHMDEINQSIITSDTNICQFDYYVIDKYGISSELLQRNSEIKTKLTAEGMQIMFIGPTTEVIKNYDRKNCNW